MPGTPSSLITASVLYTHELHILIGKCSFTAIVSIISIFSTSIFVRCSSSTLTEYYTALSTVLSLSIYNNLYCLRCLSILKIHVYTRFLCLVVPAKLDIDSLSWGQIYLR